MYYEKLLKHKPIGISEEIEEYVNNTVFSEAHYIFYKSRGKKQEAYCTSCKHEFITNGMKHNEENECPYCYGKFKSKSSGMKRKTLVHSATLLWYEKSKNDNYSVVARGFTVVRDYSDDFHNVKDRYMEHAFYLFSVNGSRMLIKDWWRNVWFRLE